jgi:N utilization substance protein A
MASEKEAEGQTDLTKLTGVGPAMAQKLVDKGINSIAMVAAAEPELLSSLPGVGEKTALHWIESAGKILDEEALNDKKAS